ncbi:MAG: sulfite exporter TauE/SafE family protein [Candidatus Marinimicrobia bacterium]|nr:sulfite exporter TauE/SafE family protein [Candidatus Neomarinimicrobiota bacterium]MCF7828475.1 sulfite exporter TauE/SafE family protein [Candidatus Neomarinimicrobiota bacterium]MCF7881965.1 sulfite exporter TauE/SafE family protein [Candidatus Neomarinimicrobiota bacterium]
MSYRSKGMVWIGCLIVFFVIAGILYGEFKPRETMLLLGLCFACELIDSGLGMGYGTILTPTLLLVGYQPAEIVPTILFSELLSGFSASFFHNEIKNVDFGPKGKDFKPALLLAGGSLVGVTAGVLFALQLPAYILKPVIGSIILLSGFFVVLLSRRILAYRNWKMLSLSGIASFNKAVSGGGYGPLVTSGQILSGVQGKTAVGITSFAEAFTCLIAVTLFLLKGGYINLGIIIPMLTGALISVPFSVFAINKSNEDHLKIIIGILTMAMGILIIYKSFN